jgi:hypothetical protein
MGEGVKRGRRSDGGGEGVDRERRECGREKREKEMGKGAGGRRGKEGEEK